MSEVEDLKKATHLTFLNFYPTTWKTWNNVKFACFDEKLSVQCNASKHLYTQGIQWAFQLSDGSSIPAPISGNGFKQSFQEFGLSFKNVLGKYAYVSLNLKMDFQRTQT
jgi:hypothetical protein